MTMAMREVALAAGKAAGGDAGKVRARVRGQL